MKIRVVAVGALKSDPLRALVGDYVRRIARYCAIEEIELKDGPKLAAQIDRAAEGYTVVALDVVGTAMTSRQLAQRLERLASRGKGQLAFFIGGADGLPRALVDRADERWSLSKLTLPHRLARVVLCEQLYRGLTILRGEPYDH